MIVKAHNDVSLVILSDPEHNDKYKGDYISWPNSVRRDVRMQFTLPANEMSRISKTPYASTTGSK